MMWGFIGFIIAIVGIYLILSSFFDEDDSSLTCCCSFIPVLIVMYLFLYFNYKGQLLVLAVIYTIFFIKNPGQIIDIFDIISNISDEIFSIITSIINIFKKDNDSIYNNSNKTQIYYSINNDSKNNPFENDTSKKYNDNKQTEQKKKFQNNKQASENNNKTKNNSHYHLNQLDINKATQEELEKTKGITKVTAKKIIDLRKKGIYITSYKLRDFLDISTAEEVTIIKNIYISEDMKKEKTSNSNKYTKPIKKYYIKPKQYNYKTQKQNNNYKTSKKEEKYKKVDINKADFTDINGIPGLTSLMASKIIKLRTEGKYIESFDDLKDMLRLSQFQLNQIKEYIILPNDSKKPQKNKFTRVEKKKINLKSCTLHHNSNHHEVNLNIQDNIRVEDVITNLIYRISSAYNNQTFANTQKERNENFNQLEEQRSYEDKIFINSADEEQLSKLPGFHLIHVKKLIQLRQNNIYMNSFNDLVEQVGIDSEYINQLSGIIIFDKVRTNKVKENKNKIEAPKNRGRRIDL